MPVAFFATVDDGSVDECELIDTTFKNGNNIEHPKYQTA